MKLSIYKYFSKILHISFNLFQGFRQYHKRPVHLELFCPFAKEVLELIYMVKKYITASLSYKLE